MTLFSIIPPAAPSGQHSATPAGMTPITPPGQHSRGGAGGSGGSGKPRGGLGTGKRPATSQGKANQKKEPSAFKKALDKLSTRERVMVATLAVLSIVALVAFLVVLPAIDRINELESEIATLEQQKSEIRVEPDRTAEYQSALEAALKDFENYQRFYYPFMDPEVIDKTLTNMLLAEGLDPERFTMSAIAVERLPPYSATQTLVPRPVPTVEEADDTEEGADAEGAEGEGADAEGAEGADGAATEGADAEGATEGDTSSRSDELASEAENAADGSAAEGAEGEAAQGSLIYCYTVNIEAKGWMSQLFAFLNSARTITAMEVVAYSYADPEETVSREKPTTTTEPEGGTIVMRIKLYVFLSGDMTTGEATAAGTAA